MAQATATALVAKPLLPVAGVPLLTHVARRFAPQVGPLAVSLHSSAQFSLPPEVLSLVLRVLVDDGGLSAGAPACGPLQGIATALEWALTLEGVSWLAIVPADCPLLPPDLVFRLWQAVEMASAAADRPSGNGGPSGVCACACSGERVHPVVSLLSLSLLSSAREALQQGRYGVWRWLQQHHVSLVDWDAEAGDPFMNINHPEDLSRVAALLDQC